MKGFPQGDPSEIAGKKSAIVGQAPGCRVGIHSAFMRPMDLYDVKARGLHSPLNSREIGRLFRSGDLDGRQVCKPRGEAQWRTVDELFPLLKYEAAAPPLRFNPPGQPRSKLPLISVCALLLALFGTVMFYHRVQTVPPTVVRLTQEKQPAETALSGEHP